MKFIFVIVFLLIVSVFVYQISRFFRLEKIGKDIAHITLPYSIHIRNPAKRVLVIGDSLAVGVGASTPERSIAGLLSTDYPTTDITNFAVSGSKIKDVLKTLESSKDLGYDLLLIQVGGNDVVQFTPVEDAATDMDSLLKLAKTKSSKVIFYSSGSVGFAPIFIPPVSWVYTYRTTQLYSALKKVADDNNVTYIDLLYSKKDDPFKNDIDEYYANDYFHVSDAGYKFWYEKIKPHL
jgi:lysophospholipase L1-like esterase